MRMSPSWSEALHLLYVRMTRVKSVEAARQQGKHAGLTVLTAARRRGRDCAQEEPALVRLARTRYVTHVSLTHWAVQVWAASLAQGCLCSRAWRPGRRRAQRYDANPEKRDLNVCMIRLSCPTSLLVWRASSRACATPSLRPASPWQGRRMCTRTAPWASFARG